MKTFKANHNKTKNAEARFCFQNQVKSTQCLWIFLRSHDHLLFLLLWGEKSTIKKTNYLHCTKDINPQLHNLHRKQEIEGGRRLIIYPLSCFSNSLKSSSVALSINGNATFTPLRTTSACRGLILFSKLNAKYCGNSFKSSKLPFISSVK